MVKKMDAAKNTAPVLKTRQTHIIGKVLRIRRYQQFTYTTIVCPAADEYSQPQKVELRSDRKFAERDEVASVVAQLGGYEGKPYKYTDKDTGEVTMLTPVTLYLDFIDVF